MFDERLNELKAYLLNSHPKYKESLISIDALVDAVVAIHDDCKAFTGAEKTGPIPKFLQRYGQVIANLKALRLNKEDFHYIRLLAKGQFGEVSLVRGKFDQKVYAMKALRKTEMLKQQDIAFFMEERQILAALDSRWITNLFAAFQDDVSLYLVMDYLPGGDLSNLIMRADEGTLQMDESFVKFYIAETLMALGDLHKLNFVHRDLKPGNILLDAKGHVKLADFGSCIQLDEKNGVSSQVTVGTPDYISPEVLQANEGKGSYGKECDFWSLGITMYEMLVGDPPFYAESLAETYSQIMAHEKFFSIPEDVKLSADAESLLRKLICDKSKRLRTVDDIKAHPFFKDIKWDKLHETQPPFKPDIKNDEDVSNFAELDDEDDVPAAKSTFSATGKTFNGTHLAFIGYSFTRFKNLSDIVASTEMKQAIKGGLQQSDSVWETKLAQAESECEKLRTKLLQEGKKIASLENSQTTMENELTRIRKVLSTEMEKLVAKEEQITQLERDKKMTAIELDNTHKKYNQTLEERADLEIRLNQIQEELQREKTNSAQTKESQMSLQQEKKSLEMSLESVQKKLQGQQDKINEYNTQIAELQKAKAILDIETEHLRADLEDERLQKDEIVGKLMEIETQVAHERARKSAVEEALNDAESLIKDLRQELDQARSELAQSIRMREEMNQRIVESESAKNAADREVLTLKLKVEEMSAQTPAQPHTNQPVVTQAEKPGRRNSILFNKRPAVSHDNKQLELEMGLRKQANQEAAKIAAEKLAVENQLKDTQMKLNAAKQDLAESKKLVKVLEDKLHEKKTQTTTLSRGKSRLTGSDYDLSSLDSETRTKLEKKIADFKRQTALTAVELADLKKKLEDEQLQKAMVEVKANELEAKLFELTGLKESLERKSEELERVNESLSRDLQMSRNEFKKLSALKESQDERLEDLAKVVATVETERDEVQQKFDLLSKQKSEAESEIESMKRRLNELLNSHIDPDEFAQLAEECNRFHKELIEVTSKYDDLSVKYKRLANDLDSKKLLRIEDNSNNIIPRNTSFVGSVDDLESVENTKRTRMNNAKMKGMEQQLSVEVARRAALETELAALKQTKQVMESEIEDLRKQLARLPTPSSNIQGLTNSFDRPPSVASSSHTNVPSLRGPINIEYKMRKLRPLLFPENSSSPMLQGWLRVRIPKNAKKTKFDWVKRYAVVRDSKLFLYEREKDVANLDIKPVFNMRSDLFNVREINANELIHLSAKEVSAVFCIQIITSGYTSLVSLDNLAAAAEDQESVLWDRRLNAVNKSLEKEARFKEANEKMLSITSGDTKKRIQAELDECLRRQKILKQEKSDIEKAIKQIESDTMTINSLDPVNERDEVSRSNLQNLEIVREIEKKEAYKRGVENMLTVTTNNEAKQSLASQLLLVSQDINALRTSLTSLENLDAIAASNGKLSSPKKLMRKPKIFEQTMESFKTSSSPAGHELTGASYFMALDEIDKQRWIAGIDCVRTNVRETRKTAAGDIDSILQADD